MFVKLASTLFCCLVLLANGCGSKTGDGQTIAPANAPETASASPASPSSSPANVNGTASPQTPTNSSASEAAGTGFLDACAMINKSEIAATQGAPVQSMVPSTQTNAGLAISQCYYTVSSADGSKNLSVHLEVIQPNLKIPNAVKDYWERTFGEKHKGEGGEEEKESKPPQPVSGVGEEAFWIGNARVGALYALHKGKMVRVSVGGADDAKTKIEKSKKLAADVLKRLS
jgi:hypothetical protein